MTGSSEFVNIDTENWQKAIGGHRIWGSADVQYDCEKKKFTMTLTISMEDFYNFNAGQFDIATGLPDDINGRFEVFGWSKSFYSKGNLMRTIAWTKGNIPDSTDVNGTPRRGRGRRGRR